MYVLYKVSYCVLLKVINTKLGPGSQIFIANISNFNMAQLKNQKSPFSLHLYPCKVGLNSNFTATAYLIKYQGNN